MQNEFEKKLYSTYLSYLPEKEFSYPVKMNIDNRGSFTEWCGGKVTEECIRRGKNSNNPKIRKKATFAQNARAWNK